MVDRTQIRTYRAAECVIFKRTNERFGGLSNMAPGFPLMVNDVGIRTSEALYQACRFPHRPELQRLIIDQVSPMTAKMLIKPYRRYSRGDWNHIRVKIMRWCLRIKLAQNWDTFSHLLLATETQQIVEESTKDEFWAAKFVDDNTLLGQNILGRLLMELREELYGQETERLKCIRPPDIPNFLLLERPIQTVRERIFGLEPQKRSLY